MESDAMTDRMTEYVRGVFNLTLGFEICYLGIVAEQASFVVI